MLSEVRRKHPFHGSVRTCERPLHGRHGAAPRLSGRVCAGICRGEKAAGTPGWGCGALRARCSRGQRQLRPRPWPIL